MKDLNFVGTTLEDLRKKTKKTAQRDIDLAKARLKQIRGSRS